MACYIHTNTCLSSVYMSSMWCVVFMNTFRCLYCHNATAEVSRGKTVTPSIDIKKKKVSECCTVLTCSTRTCLLTTASHRLSRGVIKPLFLLPLFPSGLLWEVFSPPPIDNTRNHWRPSESAAVWRERRDCRGSRERKGTSTGEASPALFI